MISIILAKQIDHLPGWPWVEHVDFALGKFNFLYLPISLSPAIKAFPFDNVL